MGAVTEVQETNGVYFLADTERSFWTSVATIHDHRLPTDSNTKDLNKLHSVLNTFHRFPSATDYRGGMPLRGDEIRRRRKRHSSIEFLVDRVYVFRGFVRRQNWDVGHTIFLTDVGFLKTVGNCVWSGMDF
jgi:hypothetical protein